MPINKFCKKITKITSLMRGTGYRMRIAELEEKNERLALLASHDELTGVYNRRGFFEIAKYLLSSLEEKQKKSGERRLSHINVDKAENLSLLFIDMNNFKGINDTLGHEAGDCLLVSFTRFLKTQIRHTDVVGRLGGDEFAILLTEDDLSSGKKTAKKIHKTIKSFPFSIDDKEVSIDFSYGVSSTSKSNGNFDLKELMRDADLEMYKMKEKKGKGNIQ